MQNETGSASDTLATAHAQLLTDDSLQFAREGFTPPVIPGWLNWIGDLLRLLAPALTWIFWIGLAVVAGALLIVIGRELIRLRLPKARAETPDSVSPPEWRPDAQAARDLLAEADVLAARGLYAEAAHLLLLRSVEDIQRRKPRALGISLTTREIAGEPSLPEAARPAFALIGRMVERSLFGSLPLDAGDFADCRRAYEAFAVPAGSRS